MEAVVHLDRLAAMPSQSQMSYQRNSALHGRPSSSQERDVRSYKTPQQHLPVSSHNPGPYSSVSSYSPMRYIHPAPYAPPPGATPVSYRENPYTSSRNTPTLVERPNADYVRNDQIKPRLSLLNVPPTSEYLSLSRNRLHQNEGYREQLSAPPPPSLPPSSQQSVEAPLKKIRLGEPPKNEGQRNLRVETRDETQPAPPSYNPQVEAISPTLPPDTLQEDANFRSTKDDLLHGIAKVDREITKTELQISKLKRKQQELEEAAKKPAAEKEKEEPPQPKHQSPAQKIYAENRKKAHEAHQLLAPLGPKIDLPLYNQPSDTPIYLENKKKHVGFRKRLLEHLRRKHTERESREKHITSVYSQMVQDWLKKVEKLENSQKRKLKDAKNREFFEKVFPRLRKQREDKERFNRVGARIKSEADIEEIMDGLQEQENEDKKMRSYAVVPPLLLDAQQRSICYINNNGRIDDFAAEYKEKQFFNVWTAPEKEIFKEKFLQHPKNFGVIASYLDKKDVCDCVQYYYLSKKTENYKRLLRKTRARQRTRNPQSKVNSGSAANPNLDILASASGVTTRLQREQQQKQEPLPSAPSELEGPFLLEPQPPTLLLPSEVKPEKKKEDKEEKKNKEDEETTDEDNLDSMQGDDMENISGVACAICKTESSCSRALPRSQASQYGLKEEEVPADARVCNLCRCKAVRSRFTNCPIPTCPNAKGHRVKRLRPLPNKWMELTPSVKEPIAAEFQIDETITKCCSACFNRISRRIGVGMDIAGNPPEDSNADPNAVGIFVPWTEDDIESLKKAIKIHGLRWDNVSLAVGKSQQQCMSYYVNQQQKLGIEEPPAPEEKREPEEQRKPMLTDEEESGSSTSSCDEDGEGRVPDPANDSDTTSAPSPLQNQVTVEPLVNENIDKMNLSSPPPPTITDENHGEGADNTERDSSPASKSSAPPTLYPAKEDYDSSATETADEGQGAGDTETSVPRASTPKREEEEESSSLTVKDLMLGVIEMQLMKNQGNQSAAQSGGSAGGPPTISSILKSDHHNISSYQAQREKANRQHQLDLSRERESLATVSVVNTLHSHVHQNPPELPKEGLVVVQVQQPPREPPREAEGVTLDLSIKKPREVLSSQTSKIQHQLSSQGTVFRVAQPPDQQGFFHQQVLTTPLGSKLSPGVISGSNSSSSSASKSQCGSIIHGTPVSSPNLYPQNRYEQPSSSLIHQVPTQHKESGSITQGTPVHQRGSLYPNTEYFQKRSIPASGGYFSPRPTSYNVEQRQIIMNDYITSQQMHGGGGSSASRTSRDKLYYQSNTRQGVIQRHNTKPPSPGVSHYPPGHEAFSSLVDVAVRQPSLPVPPPTISMSSHDHKSIQDEKRHVHEGLGERFNRDSPHDRYASREPDRYKDSYMRESHSSKSQQQPGRDNPTPQSQMREGGGGGYPGGQQHHQHMDREAVHQQIQREREREREREQRERDREREREREREQERERERRDSQHIGLSPHLDMRVGVAPRTAFQQRLLHHEPPSHHSQAPTAPPSVPMDQRLVHSNLPPPLYSQQSTNSSSTPSRSHPNQEQSGEPQNRVRCPENSTLTAASLIDAIITHQINQSAEAQTTSVPSGTTSTPQSQPTRPGDRLFQSFHRECSEANGKLSPAKSVESSKSHSGPPQSQIMDHVDMYPAVSQSIRSSGMYQGYDHQTWKLRRALQQKEEQGNIIDKSDEHMPRFYQESPVPLSPLDYVKNRIAEVMRTSEEDSGTGKESESPGSGEGMQDDSEPHTTNHPPAHSSSHGTSSHPNNHPNVSHSSSHPVASHSSGHTVSSHSVGSHPSSHPTVSHSNPHPSTFLTQSHTYAYPFSALSLYTSAPSSVPPLPTHPQPKTEPSIPVPEPAPLLSSQYDPLSDED